MFGLSPATKIYVGVEAVDMRKGFEHPLHSMLGHADLRQRAASDDKPDEAAREELLNALAAEEDEDEEQES